MAILGVACAILVVGLPTKRARRAPARQAGAERELALAVQEFAQVEGRAPGTQLAGAIEPRATMARFLADLVGPGKLLASIPANPHNGRRDVRVLAPNEPRPPALLGEHGWIYDPRDAVVWMDTPLDH